MISCSGHEIMDTRWSWGSECAVGTLRNHSNTQNDSHTLIKSRTLGLLNLVRSLASTCLFVIFCVFSESKTTLSNSVSQHIAQLLKKIYLKQIYLFCYWGGKKNSITNNLGNHWKKIKKCLCCSSFSGKSVYLSHQVELICNQGSFFLQVRALLVNTESRVTVI